VLDISSSLLVDVQLSVFASSLGCATDTYAAQAITILTEQLVDVSSYTFRYIRLTA
jgi:hypothetical protein